MVSGTTVTPSEPYIGISAGCDDDQRGGVAGALGVDLRRDIGKVASRAVNDVFRARQLHVDCCPPPRPGCRDRIDLRSRVVLIVTHVGTKRSAAQAQIAHAERLEKKAERIQIAPKLVGPGIGQARRQRGIDDVRFAKVRTLALDRSTGDQAGCGSATISRPSAHR